MRRFLLAAVLGCLGAAGCGPNWPKDTVASPNMKGTSKFDLAPAVLRTDTISSTISLPASAKVANEGCDVRGEHARVTVFLSPHADEEKEDVQKQLKLLFEGKAPKGVQEIVVARPWIGFSATNKMGDGRLVRLYDFMTDDMRIELAARWKEGDEKGKAEAESLVAHILRSIEYQ